MIEKLFSKDEKHLNKITTEAISECHKFLRKIYDPSIVSLREIERFSKYMKFFQKYFIIKNENENRDNNEKNNKLRSIICSIYICYYIRLTNLKMSIYFECELKYILLKLINNEGNIDEKGSELMDEITNQDLKYEIIHCPEEDINNFSDFLRIEQEYILNKIELDKGISKNTLLKENIFLFFLSAITR